MKARVVIRAPVPADLPAFVAAAKASAKLHRPWVAAPATPQKFREWFKSVSTPRKQAFLVCRKDDGALAGVINMSEIVRGNFRSAYLGYYAFAGHERQGLMAEGMRAVVRHAFTKMKLHRLEANIQPGNAASLALARACGFRKEGFSPKYLKIGGRWCDHERWAIVAG
ncbi:GNAT family N-acetyltransferase [Ramlibacter sp. PS4R-6]|uniref:GNAT family N-acetyltransferase n=1 Tax=Ramlibacter sp. PS4R-6 TaxID=3133438 RepID=UPI0030AAD082